LFSKQLAASTESLLDGAIAPSTAACTALTRRKTELTFKGVEKMAGSGKFSDPTYLLFIGIGVLGEEKRTKY